MPSKIEKQQWIVWLDDPVTRSLREWAGGRRAELRDMWEGGHFKGLDHFESSIRDSAAQGACSVYQEIEALDYELVIGEQEDVSAERTEDGPAGELQSDRGY